jgi:hypothetical protein
MNISYDLDPQLTELLIHFVNGMIAHSLPQYSAQLNTDIHKKFSAGTCIWGELLFHSFTLLVLVF